MVSSDEHWEHDEKNEDTGEASKPVSGVENNLPQRPAGHSLVLGNRGLKYRSVHDGNGMEGVSANVQNGAQHNPFGDVNVKADGILINEIIHSMHVPRKICMFRRVGTSSMARLKSST
jgi:hypothetical protein